MVSRTYESELAEIIELKVEGYWINGMSLSDAREKAANEIIENAIDEPIATDETLVAIPSQH